VLSLPGIFELGEVAFFVRWSLVAAPVAIATWWWAFVGRRTSGVAVCSLSLALLLWAVLLLLGREAWIHLAIRDAFFLRRPALEAGLRAVLWGYLVFPLLLMAGGVTAVVEYLRHPPSPLLIGPAEPDP
jgi:hypothetical protein